MSLVAVSVFLGNVSIFGLYDPDALPHAQDKVFFLIEEPGFFHPTSYKDKEIPLLSNWEIASQLG